VPGPRYNIAVPAAPPVATTALYCQGETPMLATSFTCPACGTMLKLATPVAAGKKIKCPKCTGIFTMPEGDARPAASESPYGDVATPAGARSPGADPAYPPAGDAFSDRPTADYGRPAPLSPAERQRLTDSDQPLAPSDRPAPNRFRRAGLGGASQGASHTGRTVAIVLGCIVMAAGLFAFAAWVWPGFWKKA